MSMPQVDVSQHEYLISALAATTISGAPSPTYIDAIPLEILQEIFALSVLKGHWLQPHPPGHLPKFDRSALMVASVSKTWRSIALSLPELWTTMAVYDPSAMAIEKVQLYLSRAGDVAPFSLYLTQHRGVGYGGTRDMDEKIEEANNTKEIINLWFTHVERWGSIYFEFNADGLPSMLEKASPEQLRNLRDVGFSTTFQSSTGFKEFWDNIHTSPNLRSIFCGHTPPPGYLLSAPLNQLTRVTLHSASLTELCQVFRGCPLLEHLTILGVTIDTARPTKPIVVQHLQSLHFDDAGLKTLAIILEVLTTPSLRDLALYNMPEGMPQGVLKRFLARSQCSLRTLLLRESWHYEAFGILYMAELGDNGVGYLDELEKLSCQCSINCFISFFYVVGEGLATASLPHNH
ncbi:hypothetical protein BDN72DRAFT_883605 [Pluteus cervinus]|uniref:Uncharacterized protein n=1 Tax=Pluteus cervinus TaxID=181527 RepID=A0ACD3A4H4_9AGAR|nr:hypothetical protein BDN72DRAFT_883605 [Pluteus cervinus]